MRLGRPDAIPGTSILVVPEGGSYVVFQQADGYQPPVWQPAEGRRRAMMHFDFPVGDLDAASPRRSRSGATLADHQAGHPFCLCRDD